MKRDEQKVPQIITDYKTMVYKLYNRKDMREEQKVQALEQLANKFATGYPFRPETEMAGYGAKYGYRNALELLARTLHANIHRQMLVKQGKNIGTMDNTELDSAQVYTQEKKKKPVIVR
jgi:hypothetical protein